MRSPMPASPANVSGEPPIATPSRVISARPAGDERGPRVVAEAHALGHARGDGDDVLDHAGDLAADHVGVGVDPQAHRGEDALQLAGDDVVVDGHHAGRRLAGEDLLGQVRPGEHGDRVAGQLVVAHLAHPLERESALEPLGQAHDRHPGPDERAPPPPAPSGSRATATAITITSAEPTASSSESRGHAAASGRVKVGQVVGVHVVGVDLLGQLGPAGPQHGRGVLARRARRPWSPTSRPR